MLKNRRTFLKEAAAYSGGLLLAGTMGESMASSLSTMGMKSLQPATDWSKQVGLELHTVRDQFAKDPEGTLAKVAEIGYTEIEPTSLGNFDAKQFKALMDKYKLTSPSTHAGGVTEGPDMEKQLEAQQMMGIRYSNINTPNPQGARQGGGAPTAQAQAPRAGGAAGGAQQRPGFAWGDDDRVQYRIGPELKGRATFGGPPQSVEDVKKSCAELNRKGKLAKKFNIKMHIHNHAAEFEACTGSTLRPYDIMLAETDPDLVAMQLDIGWACIAGQDIVGMFKKNPGRFELWHVKDIIGVAGMSPSLNMGQRAIGATIVPLGQGDINYKEIFANAELAGLKHYCIEQDTAASWGDSMAAARVSYLSALGIINAVNK